MAVGDLPEDGELRLGPVALPAGKRIRSAAHQETGLVPILLSGLGGDARDTRRPWDDGEFDAPANITQVEHMDAASVLREMWDSTAYEDDEYD